MKGDLATWQFALATIVVIGVSYVLGYLLIDALGWVTLNQDQVRGGYMHIFRILGGMLFLALPMMAWITWEARPHGAD